jgi:hypothetical protein
LVLPANNLVAQFSGGDGSASDPYQITTAAQLNSINSNYGYSISCFILENDIALTDYQSGSGWPAIGNIFEFAGKFYGHNHKITGLVINNPTAIDQGLFGHIGGAEIDSLGVDGTIAGGSYVGGLVGYAENNNIITNCYSTCNVTGSGGFIGGLVGFITGTGGISNCYSKGSVTGTTGILYIGGLIGAVSVNVSNCYSTAAVIGTGAGDPAYHHFGGLIGSASGFDAGHSIIISNCYSAGAVASGGGGIIGDFQALFATMTNCFWDIEASVQATGSSDGSSVTGAVGESTTLMKTQSTFTEALWNDSIWNIDEAINNGYPYLAWQNISGTPLPVELSSFTSAANKNGIILHWSTATEVNNYGFDVEREAVNSTSSTENNWVKIGFVAGKGTSNSSKAYSFADLNISSGRYAYRLKQIDNNGTFIYSQSVEQEVNLAPAVIGLNQNYPNPFNPSTRISFAVAATEKARLVVYNMLGQPVVTLFDGIAIGQQAYRLSFDASKFASGVYFYKLVTPTRTDVRRMQLLK